MAASRRRTTRAGRLPWERYDSERVASAFSGRIRPVGGDVMSAVVGFVIASGVQGGDAPAPAHETILIGIIVVAMVLAFGLIALYLRRQHRRPKPVTDQWQALAVMGELCAHGWQAHITLYGWGAPVPEDAPASRVPLVELEWKQFEEESGQVRVARRVWAPTIAGALQSMLDDRVTDLTLEQIEQGLEGDEEEEW